MSDDPDDRQPASDTEQKATGADTNTDAAERAALIRDIRIALDQMTPDQLARLQTLIVLHVGNRK